MKYSRVFYILFMGMIIIAPAFAQSGINWKQELASALEPAGQAVRPVFVFFHDEKSDSSKTMNNSIFTQSDVIRNLEPYSCVLLDMSTPAARAAAGNYSIIEVPAFLILNRNGNPVVKVMGEKKQDAVLGILKNHAELLKVPFIAPTDTKPVITESPAVSISPAATPAKTPDPAEIFLYGFEDGIPQNLISGGDRDAFCIIDIVGSGARTGQRCLRMQYDCRGWGVAMTVNPSGVNGAFADLRDARTLIIRVKAPLKQMFSFKIDEGGTAAQPVNGSDGECWYSRDFMGFGEWRDHELRIPQDFKMHTGLCETKGNKKLDLGHIFGMGIGIGQGTGVLLTDDISWKK